MSAPITRTTRALYGETAPSQAPTSIAVSSNSTSLQNRDWKDLHPLARKIALEALTGQMANPGIGLASEFASTWILYGRKVGPKNRTEEGWLEYTRNFKRSKGGRWIGLIPNLDQKRNAFFINKRAVDLPVNAVQVLPTV
jgi:hypothetical protein